MFGYLFVHFAGEETENTEQIYFSISKNGMTWETLNDGKPVIASVVGEKGLRDPHILRRQDGSFVIVATDLSIYNNGSWARATTKGSQSIAILESEDLLHWSELRLVKVASDESGCTWAPETIYDKDKDEYMIFWASQVASDQYAKQRIYRINTKDFIHFDDSTLYIEKNNHIIDTTIVEYNGVYYRFSKDETNKAILMESGDTLRGDFTPIDSFSLAKVEGYEGPTCFRLNGEDKWCLLLDAYATNQGYQAFVTDDLAKGEFKPVQEAFVTPFKFRHGTVIPITEKEYNGLVHFYK